MTGKTGTFHTQAALAYGTQMVGGVTPGKGGTTHIGLPVFDTVPKPRPRPARPPSASMCRRRSPPMRSRGDRRRDAADRLHHRRHSGARHGQGQARASGSKSRLIGPNCPGVLTPGECKIGIMPGSIFKKGSVGVVSRSGTLTYEAVFQTTRGPGPDHRGRHRRRSGQRHQLHRRARTVPRRPETEVDHHDRRNRRIGRRRSRAIHEADAPRAAAKPMVGFIAGRTAPPGRRMGHAGAIVSGGRAARKTRSRRWKMRASASRPRPRCWGKPWRC
jgi:succinyl-CoA synthetase alpha subunit